MNHTMFRTLLAGSLSAVAALGLMGGTTAHAAEDECAPIYVDNGDGTAAIGYPDFCDETPMFPGFIELPEIELVPPFEIDIDDLVLPPLDPSECTTLDLADLEVRAAQTSPDDWQWRFEINGDTSNLCNEEFQAAMYDLDSMTAVTIEFDVYDILNANDLGEDYIASFVTPCRYTTTVVIEALVLDQYADQEKRTDDCVEIFIPGLPEDPETPDTPEEEPETPDTPEVPETPDTPEVPEVEQQPEVPGTPDGDLPRTGSDSTALMVGLGMLVLGSGLAFTSMSMTRRRRSV